MFPILAKAAIRATGLAGYAIPSFTFTFATTAIAVESHPTATPLDKSVHETETEDKPGNFLVESLARSESTSSSRLASELQSMGINSPLEGRRLVFEERCAISKPASKITTRDADLKCLSKNDNSKTDASDTPSAFNFAEVFEGAYEPSINSTMSSPRPTRPGRNVLPDEKTQLINELLSKLNACETSLERLQDDKSLVTRQLQESQKSATDEIHGELGKLEEKHNIELEFLKKRIEFLEVEHAAQHKAIQTLQAELSHKCTGMTRADRLIDFEKTAVDSASEVVDTPVSDSGFRKRREHDVGFDSSEREVKRSRHEHAGNHGGTPTRGRPIYRNATGRFSRAKSFVTRKHSIMDRQKQPSNAGREVPIHDSPPSMVSLIPLASMAKDSANNISQGSGSSGNADDEASLDGHGKLFIASTSTLAPSDSESKPKWPLFRKFTGRSASRGSSPSPASRALAPPETPTRPRSRRRLMKGAATVPAPNGHGSLSPTSTGPRSQTAPSNSSQGLSRTKRKQEVTVYSYYDEDRKPDTAGSASKKQKNN